MVLWREARWWGLTASIPALVKEMWRGSLSCVSAVTGCWHRALDFTRSLVWSSRENFRDQSTLGFVSVSAGDLYKTGALKGPLVKCEVWTRLDPAVIRKWLFILYIDRKNFFFLFCLVSVCRVILWGRVVCVKLIKSHPTCFLFLE